MCPLVLLGVSTDVNFQQDIVYMASTQQGPSHWGKVFLVSQSGGVTTLLAIAAAAPLPSQHWHALSAFSIPMTVKGCYPEPGSAIHQQRLHCVQLSFVQGIATILFETAASCSMAKVLQGFALGEGDVPFPMAVPLCGCRGWRGATGIAIMVKQGGAPGEQGGGGEGHCRKSAGQHSAGWPNP